MASRDTGEIRKRRFCEGAIVRRSGGLVAEDRGRGEPGEPPSSRGNMK